MKALEHPLDTLLRHPASGRTRVVLDLGTGTGGAALELRRRLPTADIFSFDPSPIAIEQSRLSFIGTSIEAIPFAAHEIHGTVHLYPSGTNSATASTLPPLRSTSTAARFDVPAVRVDSWAASRGIATVDLVWCDIEGDSLATLRGFGALLSTVRLLYVSVLHRPIYTGQPTLRQVDNFLRGFRFRQIAHGQVVSGCWGYVLYVGGHVLERSLGPATPIEHDSDAYASAPYVRGGIGDLLQHIGAAAEEQRVRVYSHYIKAKDVFRPFGVTVEHHHFTENTAHMTQPRDGAELTREYFPVFSMPKQPVQLATRNYRRVLGLQPFGSPFSNAFSHRLSTPAKWMTIEYLSPLLNSLLTDDDLLLVFCAPDERQHLQSVLPATMRNVSVVAHDYIWDSLSMVSSCSFVIGVDSAIKTMSSILRIPTVTLVGDYADSFRDTHFLSPYVAAGVMKTIRFQTLGDREVAATYSAAKSFLDCP